MVLTSLGQEHMEYFGTLEGVAAEECSAFAMVQPQGTVVLPGDEPTWSLIQPHLGQLSPTVKRYTFGRGNHHTVHLKNFQPTSTGSRVLAALGVQAHELTLPLPGKHNALNALSALLVGQAMGLELSKLAEALASATPAPQRGQLQRYQMGEGVITVLNDSYNANPDSMRAALDMLLAMPDGDRSRKLAVLGDMLELGSQSPDLHRVLGRDLAQRREKLGLVILIGRMSMFTAEALLKEGFPPERLVTFAGWSEDLPMKVCAQWQPGDLVLLKASRGMGLERLLAGLKQE
ncbi:MAG: UDP-N-acetylmuramoyl-tripeptide--D-alanyl-D-alanine ligase [Phycisphaerales bacterium]|nr:UDP-N-acetylmuramoyl-tripeptide--D-alanyl-D-alanine ligase [Phycisphaerales bacterium]